MSALTTWLTAIADAIRGKDGTEDPIDHADFPAKITAIPQLDTSDATATESDILLGETAYAGGVKLTGTNTNNADTTDATLTANDMLYGVTGYGPDGTKLTGEGAYWQYSTNLNRTFLDANLPAVVTIYAPNNSAGYYAFSGNANLVTLNLTSGALVGDVRNMFSGCSSLETVNGVLDFSMVTNALYFWASCAALKNVNYAQSSLKINHSSLSGSPLLSTASLLSIANGLDASSPAILTMHATSKANMNNIDVDVVDGVAILGTTKTLMQFVNTDKGWTVA